MSVDEGTTGAEGRIRTPDRRRWKWILAYSGLCLVFGATLLAQGQEMMASLLLALCCGSAFIALKQRSFGVDLTPQRAIVRGFRRRDIPWQEVQKVVRRKELNGASVVGLILESGESVILRAPTKFLRDSDGQYERDFDRIDQYWLAHRGESWHPVAPEVPS